MTSGTAEFHGHAQIWFDLFALNSRMLAHLLGEYLVYKYYYEGQHDHLRSIMVFEKIPHAVDSR